MGSLGLLGSLGSLGSLRSVGPLRSQRWPGLAGAARTTVLSLAPASCRTTLGEIYSFSQSFLMADIASITLPLNLGAGQGFQENNITKAQSCPKSTFLCLPRVGFQWFPSPRSALGISSCLTPLPWGSRLSGIEGKGSPRLALPKQDFKPLSLFLPYVLVPAATKGTVGPGACVDSPNEPGFREDRTKKDQKCW